MKEQIEAYRARVQELTDAEQFYHPPTITVDYNKRYARLVKNTKASRTVHSFVDMQTGDILKASSFKSPAKGVRGNVMDLTNGGFSAYGAWSL